MDIVFLIARILFVYLFLLSAMGHLTQSEMMGQYSAAKGVPAARASVIASGVLILVGGLMVLLGLWGDLGALLLIVFLVPTNYFMHAYWKEADPERRGDQVNFNKNVGLVGGALAFFLVFAYLAPGLTITGPLFSLA